MSEPAGQFQIESVLGKGGFGTVYRAVYRGEGGFAKRVALKVLNAAKHDFEDYARRLRDEARMMGLLAHRAIVRADRLVLIEGRWAVVMELIDGVDLAAVVKAAPVPARPAAAILAEVAGALHAARETPGGDGRPLNLLHRDLKPSNLMLTRYGEVKVLDFGGARADFEARESQTRQFSYGTQEYMAPERLDFRDSDGSDVYALGAILLELVIGERFGRTSLLPERHTARVEAALGRFQAALPAPAPRFVELARRMLAYDPARRPSARDVELCCLDLDPSLPGPHLRTWADQVVPAVAAARQAEPADALTGSLVRARSPGAVPDSAPSLSVPQAAATPTPPPRPAPPAPLPPLAGPAFGRAGAETVEVEIEAPAPRGRPRRGPRLASGLVVLIAVALAGIATWKGLGLALELYRAGRRERADAALVTDLAGVVESPAAPLPETPPAPEPVEAAPPPAPRRTERAVEPPVIEPAEAAPAPAPAPEEPETLPAGMCEVKVTGDADSVNLVAKGRWNRVPGWVSPGSYEVWAAFAGEPAYQTGRASLRAGDQVTVQCSARLRRCGVKR